MKVLVVTAHPDDMELGCSGTLRKLQQQYSAEIISVVTVCPSEEVNSSRSQAIVQSELDQSYSLSGFELRVFDTPLHDNGRPNLVCDNVTMTSLGKLFEPCDLAILPNPQDWHQDHRNTYELAWPLLRRQANTVMIMDAWPYCQDHKQITTNTHYDISAYWPFKQKLLECYSSYVTAEMIHAVHTDNHWRGLHQGFDLAESFTIVSSRVG